MELTSTSSSRQGAGAYPTRSGAVLLVDDGDHECVTKMSVEPSTRSSNTPRLRPAMKKQKTKKLKRMKNFFKGGKQEPSNTAAPAEPAATGPDKSVRFVLTGNDGSTQVIRFPGGVLRSVKIRNLPVYPISLILRLMDTQRFAHMTGAKRRQVWQILRWTLAAVGLSLLVLALAMLLVYLHLRPQLPRLMLKGFGMLISVIPVDVQQNGVYYAYSVDLGADLLIDYQNVNSGVDIHNEYMESTLFYRGTPMGKASLHHFVVPRDTRLDVGVYMELATFLMELNVGYTLIKEMNLEKFELVCELIVKARMSTIGRIKSPVFGLRVRCFILLLGYDIASQECRNFNF